MICQLISERIKVMSEQGDEGWMLDYLVIGLFFGRR